MFRAPIGRALGLWAAVITSTLSLGCSSRGAEAPVPKQPLPETRAREVIAQTVHEFGERPRGKYHITVKYGRRLEVDVGVVDHRYGVAYVTGSERSVLGDAIPPHDVGLHSLRLLRDLKERDMVVLLLHDLSYVADEHMGSDREQTAIAAELKLQRDVKDYLAKARGERWP